MYTLTLNKGPAIMPAHGEYEFLPDEELIEKCLNSDMLAWEALISQSGVNMQSIHALLPDGHLHFEATAAGELEKWSLFCMICTVRKALA